MLRRKRKIQKRAFAVILIALFLISLIPAAHFALAQQSTPTLASTIESLINNINFTADLDTAYMGLGFGVDTLQSFQSMVDALPSSQWSTILYWYAVLDKFNVANQTTIERALDAASMLPNGLPDETVDSDGNPCFLIYDRYLIYGYYWANEYQYDQSKWNLTQAYSSFDAAVTYSQTHYTTPPLWIYGDDTAKPFSGRYYDETGESLDCYLEFYKFGVTQALNKAAALWNFENSYYWNGSYYGYTGANCLFECEAGGFEQIIWKLFDYDPSIPNVQNLITDINTRYLNSLWNSPQWLDYVVQHANANPQRRLENTQMSWQSIIAAYSLLSPSSQADVQELLNGTAYGLVNGNNEVEPAWSLLSNPAADLYDPTTGLYSIYSGVTPSNSASALAANLLMDLGIIQTSAALAVPIEELHYEYTYNIIDEDLYAMDFNTDSIKIPIISPGELTFLYGSTPVTCCFNQIGIWNITFTTDWNKVINASCIGPLPSNRMYCPTSLNNEPNNPPTQQCFQLPVNVTVENGINQIQVYANSTLVYNNTVTVTNSTNELTCEIPISNLTVGNYTMIVNVNNSLSKIGTEGVTYPADLNGDFQVNFNDITTFVKDYLALLRSKSSIYSSN